MSFQIDLEEEAPKPLAAPPKLRGYTKKPKPEGDAAPPPAAKPVGRNSYKPPRPTRPAAAPSSSSSAGAGEEFPDESMLVPPPSKPFGGGMSLDDLPIPSKAPAFAVEASMYDDPNNFSASAFFGVGDPFKPKSKSNFNPSFDSPIPAAPADDIGVSHDEPPKPAMDVDSEKKKEEEAEEERKRIQQEEERRKREEETQRKEAEEQQRKKQEEEEKRKNKEAEEERKRREEEEADNKRRKAEAKAHAEEEERKKEEEARKAAEALLAEEEVRQAEEARRRVVEKKAELDRLLNEKDDMEVEPQKNPEAMDVYESEQPPLLETPVAQSQVPAMPPRNTDEAEPNWVLISKNMDEFEIKEAEKPSADLQAPPPSTQPPSQAQLQLQPAEQPPTLEPELFKTKTFSLDFPENLDLSLESGGTTEKDLPASTLVRPSVEGSGDVRPDGFAQQHPITSTPLATNSHNFISTAQSLPSPLQPSATTNQPKELAGGIEIPDDWILGWNTPQKPLPGRTAAPTPRFLSLLDTTNELVSPTSQKQYSQKDLEAACQKIRDQANKEQEFLQLEVQELTKKNKTEVERRKALQTVLEEYEATMANMIAQVKKDKEKDAKVLSLLVQENNQLKNEAKQFESTFTELKSRYDTMKAFNETYKRSEEAHKAVVAGVQQDLAKSERRYEALKAHAQKKIEEANAEIERVRQEFSKEVLSLKVQFQKAELEAKTQRAAAEAKEKENKELMEICDGLIKQLGEHS